MATIGEMWRRRSDHRQVNQAATQAQIDAFIQWMQTPEFAQVVAGMPAQIARLRAQGTQAPLDMLYNTALTLSAREQGIPMPELPDNYIVDQSGGAITGVRETRGMPWWFPIAAAGTLAAPMIAGLMASGGGAAAGAAGGAGSTIPATSLPATATMTAAPAAIGSGAAAATGAGAGGTTLPQTVGTGALWGTLLTSGLAGLDAWLTSRTANQAAQTQTDAANRAIDLIERQAAQARADAAPYLEAGHRAIRDLSETGYQPWTGGAFVPPTLADLQADPGYQFRQSEIQRAVENSAAARGKLLTGGTIRDLANYRDQLASQEFDKLYRRARDEYDLAYNRFANERANRFNTLASLAGIGQTQTNVLGQGDRSDARTIGDIGMDIGNVNAAARVAGGNALSGVLGTVGNSALDYLLRRLAP